MFGWGREAVETGLNELRTGIRCVDNFSDRGRRKTEELHPELAAQIHAMVEPESQADPKFQTPLAYTRITAKPVREQLVAGARAGRGDARRADRVRHPEPLGLSAAAGPQDEASKKLPETDAIFDHLRSKSTRRPPADPETLRISLDTKAKVKIGEFSRRRRGPGTGSRCAPPTTTCIPTRCSRRPAFWKSTPSN